MAHARLVVLAALAASVGAIGCGGEPAALVDGGRPVVRRDAGPPRPIVPYDGSFRPDAGPIAPVDPGPCTEWGIEDEGEPITGLVPGEWVWVDFPEAHCMNGSSTGIGINLSPTGSSRVVIYLEGGGACFDPSTCSGVANRRNGFGGARFAEVSDGIANYPIFDRDATTSGVLVSPVHDWTFVYVPYCTGDVHAGTNPEGYDFPDDDLGPLEQVGYLNVTAYLRRLAPTFEGAEQVLLTGSSAGGFGALANYDQVARAFGCTEVVMVDDSGPVLDDPYMRPCLQARTRELWRFHVPEDCPQCTGADGGGFVALWGYLATKYPDRRFGLMSANHDAIIRSFLSYGLSEGCDELIGMPEELFEEGLDDLRDRWLAPYPNVYTFYSESGAHTFLPASLRRPFVGEVWPAEFLRRIVEDDPALAHVAPP